MNKPGSEVEDLRGGVAGGSILRGVLKVGQEIEIRPGLVSKDGEGKLTCRPIYSRIVSLFAEQNDLMFAVPGGLIGVGTKVDPTLCRADRMVGQVGFGLVKIKILTFDWLICPGFGCCRSPAQHLHRVGDLLLPAQKVAGSEDRG